MLLTRRGTSLSRLRSGGGVARGPSQLGRRPPLAPKRWPLAPKRRPLAPVGPLEPALELSDLSLVEFVRTVVFESVDFLLEERLPQVFVVNDLSVSVRVETEVTGSRVWSIMLKLFEEDILVCVELLFALEHPDDPRQAGLPEPEKLVDVVPRDVGLPVGDEHRVQVAVPQRLKGPAVLAGGHGEVGVRVGEDVGELHHLVDEVQG